MGGGLIGDEELLIFGGFIFAVWEFEDRMIKSRIEPVFAMGVAVQDVVATADVHGDLGDSESGWAFFCEEGGGSEEGAQDEEECDGLRLDHIMIIL